MLALALLLALQADPFAGEAFERHIRFLSSPEMKGRDNGTPEGERAAQYVAERFKEFGLKPGGKDGYFQDFKAQKVGGRNVIGLLPGEKAAEFIVVAAHHDARGTVGGKVQPGADDNASGVAMVLELARSFSGTRLGRSILFVSFDAEEDGLVGSREFVKSSLYETASIAAMFVFDLIGGDFFPWEGNRFYALGSEYSAELSDRVSNHAAKAREVEVVRTAVALIEPFPEMARSDYHAFRAKGVPFVFFSTGTPWYYHTEHDTIERINFGKMVKAAQLVRRVVAETADDEKRPIFRAPARVEGDGRTVVATLERILKERERLVLSDPQADQAKSLAAELSAEREPDLKKLQQAMILIFSIARSQGKR